MLLLHCLCEATKSEYNIRERLSLFFCSMLILIHLFVQIVDAYTRYILGIVTNNIRIHLFISN